MLTLAIELRLIFLFSCGYFCHVVPFSYSAFDFLDAQLYSLVFVRGGCDRISTFYDLALVGYVDDDKLPRLE